MGTILAFAGSNSSNSLNFKLIKHTVSKISGHDVTTLNMANYPFPMYSEDEEKAKGFSNSLVEFKGDIAAADGLIIAVNEHNSYPSAYFKNLLDWLSRLDRKFIDGKNVLLMATSPGKRGGIGALEVVSGMLGRFGATVVTTYSLPSFHINFKETEGILDAELAQGHADAITLFMNKIESIATK
ncbi:NADPH-dependent FMN reductase [Spongiimicrobium salis]|uniref:NADPH-dependent FMN reductase n=1 Tax=Spongiimicrobium salis TaxID=1667022 RepID=UPI00374DB982